MSIFAQHSFTSANIFPVKILQNLPLMESIIKRHQVIPIHLQLNPSNKCNFRCNFCSCSKRDKSAMLPFEELKNFLVLFKTLGGQSTTITGGGEPLFYPQIGELLSLHHTLNLDVGLVCNGSMLDRLDEYDLALIKWIRVSCSDELPGFVHLGNWFKTLDKAIAKDSQVDWAFSYVVGANPSIDLIKQVVAFANTHKFTHVRLVNDLLNLDKAESMQNIQHTLKTLHIDDSKVIYQGRKEYSAGSKLCWISLLKPVVSATSSLFPCCGTQYSEEIPSRDYGKTMCMGSMFNLKALVEKQIPFDGSHCIRCFYREYNDLLSILLEPLMHERFV